MNAVADAKRIQNPSDDVSKMPGHWLLARMGKRVLRPGGVEMTRQMLTRLQIEASDAIVEFAPGLGDTAARLAAAPPFSYVGIDRDADSVRSLRTRFSGKIWMRFLQTPAEHTGLPDGAASVVIAEAMLSMHGPSMKQQIVAEAARLLAPDGRYGIHELCLLNTARKAELEASLSREIHNGIRLLTVAEWRDLVSSAGFSIQSEFLAPMHLLEPVRILDDEGLPRSLRILFNLACDSAARARVLSMRRVFAEHASELGAVCLISTKKDNL